MTIEIECPMCTKEIEVKASEFIDRVIRGKDDFWTSCYECNCDFMVRMEVKTK